MRRQALVLSFVLAAATTIAGGGPAAASAPSPAPLCPASTNIFFSSIPVPIPSTAPPNVVTSAVNVSGVGPSLADVDLYTEIKHTFNSDLDVTLQSPAGTIVTITTDNGSLNDNVFAGTTWDDDADPDGQVPYAGNEGMVTDATYANLAVETPLVPEEPLGAFIGENPNGDWLLTISDDASADGGSLDFWSLSVTTYPVRPDPGADVSAFSTAPVLIPTGPAVVTSVATVTGAATYLRDLDLTTRITHTANGDLDMTLRSPAGTVVTISTDNGSFNDNVFNGTLWDDRADFADGQVPYTSNDGLATDSTYANLVLESPLEPEESFAAFVGEDPNGDWTLTVSDDALNNGGSLDAWALTIGTVTRCTDATAPAVTMTRPAPGGIYVTGLPDLSAPISQAAVVAVGTPFEIQADASDAFGVTSVRFIVDGTALCDDTSAPYSCGWTPALGEHTVLVQGFDAAGNMGVASAVDVIGVGV